MLAILIMIPFIGICQDISLLSISGTLNLSKEQSLELYKGLRQGENLKDFSSSLLVLNEKLESIVEKDSITKSTLKDEIQKLNLIIKSKEDLAKKSEEEKKLEIEKVVKKNNKHWGIGLITGYGLSIQKESSFQTFIGVGVYYSIFKF